jgi:hypothetical protein
VSEDKAEIIWSREAIEKIFEDKQKKQAAAESSGITYVREKDGANCMFGP